MATPTSVTPPARPGGATTVHPMPLTDDEPRVAILEAASRLLADEGPGALTVRRIASEAGGSTMNVYSRFGGKDGVVDALYRRGFRRLADMMLAARETKDPLADLRRCALRYRRFALEHPTYYSIMFDRVIPDFQPSADAHQDAAATLALLAGKVQRALDAGQLAG